MKSWILEPPMTLFFLLLTTPDPPAVHFTGMKKILYVRCILGRFWKLEVQKRVQQNKDPLSSPGNSGLDRSIAKPPFISFTSLPLHLDRNTLLSLNYCNSLLLLPWSPVVSLHIVQSVHLKSPIRSCLSFLIILPNFSTHLEQNQNTHQGPWGCVWPGCCCELCFPSCP